MIDSTHPVRRALLLSGWLLMLPPSDSRDAFDLRLDAPLPEWSQYLAYDTARECEDDRLALAKRAGDSGRTFENRQITKGRCVPAEFVYPVPGGTATSAPANKPARASAARPLPPPPAPPAVTSSPPAVMSAPKTAPTLPAVMGAPKTASTLPAPPAAPKAGAGPSAAPAAPPAAAVPPPAASPPPSSSPTTIPRHTGAGTAPAVKKPAPPRAPAPAPVAPTPAPTPPPTP